MPEPENRPRPAKPRFLLRSSPLTAGGKARLMSAKKVEPNRAKPREVSRLEASGYTEQIHKALHEEPECLDEWDWHRHVGHDTDMTLDQRRAAEEIARSRARELLSQEERINEAVEEAQARHRNVTGELWVLRQMIARQAHPEKVEKQVQALERRVYLNRAA
jgi:hypothetical protein